MHELFTPSSNGRLFASTFLDGDRATVRVTVEAFAIACDAAVGAPNGYHLKISRTIGALQTTGSAELYTIDDILDLPLVRGAGARERLQTELLEHCFGIVAWSTYRHTVKHAVDRERVFLGVAERGGEFWLVLGTSLSYDELTFVTLDDLRRLLSSRTPAMEKQLITAQDCVVKQFAKRYYPNAL